MNILASYRWIKEYAALDVSASDFARELSLKSMSVESIVDLKERFAHVVVGEIKELKAHPNADRLQIASTDIGSEVIEIVCGGQNLYSGMKVVVALPGAQVLWHGQGDWVALEPAVVRGVKSQGMICAPSELGFEKAPCPTGGVWDLSELSSAAPGDSFIQAMDMDDILFDIEVTSNRPDSMSIVGLAREACAVFQTDFSAPNPPSIEQNITKPVQIRVEDADVCPRYMAVVMEDVTIGPSPLWLQTKLLLSGHRPINTIVDITNYILHEYGQPLHAFDYDTLEGGEIVVRRAKEGETIEALDEQIYELSPENLVIADAQKPVAIAGVMGGQKTGTTQSTRTILFEAASFDPVSVRRTARALHLYSDSQLLFEKGVSTQVPELALKRAVELTKEIAGGRVVSEVIDIQKEPYKTKTIFWRPKKSAELIGMDIAKEDMADLVRGLGCVLTQREDGYDVTIPYWRDGDLEQEHDITEEVARLFGYHNIDARLPNQAPPFQFDDKYLQWEDRTKKVFSEAGYTELFGYSFCSSQDLERYDLSSEQAISLFNPLSSELTHMRTSLVPTLLRDVERNQGERPAGCVFELQRIYLPKEADLPTEATSLVFAHYGVTDANQTFRELKGLLLHWAKTCGLAVHIERIHEDVKWHPSRSAAVYLSQKRIGTIGQVARAYQDAYGIERPVLLCEIDFETLVPSMRTMRSYNPIADFPSVERDMAIEVDRLLSFQEIVSTLKDIHPLLVHIDQKDVYEGEGIEAGKKSLTLTFTLRSNERTLTTADIEQIMGSLRRLATTHLSARIR